MAEVLSDGSIFSEGRERLLTLSLAFLIAFFQHSSPSLLLRDAGRHPPLRGTLSMVLWRGLLLLGRIHVQFRKFHIHLIQNVKLLECFLWELI